jgi:predicted transcriptional regulator
MLIDNGDHIASRIGRRGESVERDLKKLAKLGVLEAEKIGKKTWFGFDAKKDRQIQEIIKNYIRSCAESVEPVTASPQ